MIKKQSYLHLSFQKNLADNVIIPRVPECVIGQNQYHYCLEDNETPRFCMAPNIAACLNSISHFFSLLQEYPYLTFYVYTHKNDILSYTCPEQLHNKKLVFDAYLTHEIWCHEPIELILLGYFNLDASSLKEKKVVKIFNQDNLCHPHFFHYHYSNIPQLSQLVKNEI